MITILDKNGAAVSCSVFVSPRPHSVSYESDQCLECGSIWRCHKNIGSGWRQRSEAEKVQLGMYPNIILGEN